MLGIVFGMAVGVIIGVASAGPVATVTAERRDRDDRRTRTGRCRATIDARRRVDDLDPEGRPSRPIIEEADCDSCSRRVPGAAEHPCLRCDAQAECPGAQGIQGPEGKPGPEGTPEGLTCTGRTGAVAGTGIADASSPEAESDTGAARGADAGPDADAQAAQAGEATQARGTRQAIQATEAAARLIFEPRRGGRTPRC